MRKALEGKTPLDVLREKWHYDHFRPLQREVIDSVLEGRDTLALLPTGGGKSITFQVPALMLEGVTLVVSPLVALMKDQVEDLSKVRIRAAAIHSGMTHSQVVSKLESVLYADYKLLYVSPERLKSESFLAHLSALRVSLLVVDEAHCISQWGYDFRPDYLEIAEIRKRLPAETPLLALTATATPEVVSDIREVLHFRAGHRFFSKSFYRPNLTYVVRRTQDKPRMLYHILSSVEGSALVYVRTRREAVRVSELLRSFGLSATFFHAGLSEELKSQRQSDWQKGIVRIMVCTNAFGMGINKKDVRLVIHPTAPSAPETYYQEAGRAGRDDRKSYAVLLYSPGDDEKRLRRILSLQYPSREDVRLIYDHICNYLRIPVGEGYGRSFSIDLFDVQKAFGDNPATQKAAFRILEHSGYMSYRADDHRPTYVHFRVMRNELFDLFSARERLYDELVIALLRTYTGLFTDYVPIEETKVANLIGVDKIRLKTMLRDLKRWKVIDYIPGAKVHTITMLESRVLREKIFIPKSAYEEMKNRDEARCERMIEYLQDRDGCRSRYLQGYFGEKDTLPCGYCDWCLAEKPKGLTYRITDEIEALVEETGAVTEDFIRSKYPSLTTKDIDKMSAFYTRENHPVRYLPEDKSFVYLPELTD